MVDMYDGTFRKEHARREEKMCLFQIPIESHKPISENKQSLREASTLDTCVESTPWYDDKKARNGFVEIEIASRTPCGTSEMISVQMPW